MRGRPLTLVYREERHRALGRDATFSWSRALTHPLRCNRTRHRGRHLGSEVVGAAILDLTSWGRHLGSEVVGAAILDLTSWGRHLGSDFVGPPSWIGSRGGRHLGSDVVTSLTLNRHLYYLDQSNTVLGQGRRNRGGGTGGRAPQ